MLKVPPGLAAGATAAADQRAASAAAARPPVSALNGRWELHVADQPSSWRKAGFCVLPDNSTHLGGNVYVKLVGENFMNGARRGIVGWGMEGLAGADTSTSMDGIPCWRISAVPNPSSAGAATAVSNAELLHPNHTLQLDHLVVRSDDWRRSSAAVQRVCGLDEYLRKRDDIYPGLTQVFYRDGGPIVELIAPSDSSSSSSSSSSKGDRADGMGDEAAGGSSLWGITLTVDDIDATKAFLGDNSTKVKNAKQPGRRILTLRHTAVGVSVNIAFISHHVPGAVPPRASRL